MGRKLYVGNLPYETGEAELQELFGRAGTVESVRVMRDMATGRARGFAFVEMATDEDAQKAGGRHGILPIAITIRHSPAQRSGQIATNSLAAGGTRIRRRSRRSLAGQSAALVCWE